MLIKENKRLLKGFIFLTGGVVLSQLLMLITSPLITRLYTPENFGLMATYMSIIGILSVGSSLRYDLAIPSSHSIQDESNLLAISLISNSLVSSLILIVIIFIGDSLLELTKLSQLKPYKLLLPVGIFLLGTYKISIQLATKQRRYKDISKNKFYQTTSMVIFQLLFYKLGAFSLIVGNVIGQSLGSVGLIANRQTYNNVKNNISIKNLQRTLAEYKSFPIYSLPSAFMNTLGGQLPVVLLSSLYSPTIAGFYALAQRIIFLPVSMVIKSIVSILLGEGSDYKANKELDRKIWLLHQTLTYTVLPLTFPIALFLPDLFKFFFGDEWVVAGQYATILTPWFFLVFTMTPVFDAFEVFFNQKIIMIFQFILSVTRVFGIYVGYIKNDVYLSLVLFSIATILTYLIFFVVIVKHLNVNLLSLKKYLKNISIIICLVLSPFVLIFFNIDSNHIRVLTFIPSILLTLFFATKLAKTNTYLKVK